MQQKYKEGLVVRKGNGLYQKYFKETAEQTRRTATTWWDDAGLISSATSKLKALMGETTFDTPKPLELIDRMMRMITFSDENCIVMDFFSGSATTAHAVMAYNAETGGNRKYIMVQLKEAVNEKSEAYKAGYKNICEIGKERIRRAGAKIKEESPLTTQELDTGFRVLKCESSNMKDVYYAPDEYSQDQLDLFESNIKEDRTPEDLLFQVMLDLGILLSSKIVEENISGKRVFTVAPELGNHLVACFDENVSDDVIRAIADKHPTYAVLRDSSMADSAVKTNFDQIFASVSPDTVRKVL